MAARYTRADIERAVRAPAGRRSDFDLNPGAERPNGRALRDAAVLCAVVERDAGLRVVLTQRPATMRDHPGQIAFPGGKIDPGDGGPVGAALREAGEEIGLDPADADVLGIIDAYETGTGFRIAPVVALVGRRFTPVPEVGEVEEIFEPPLAFLMDPANYRLQTREWRGGTRRFYAVPWEGRHIWGATAGMLKCLSDRIRGAGR